MSNQQLPVPSTDKDEACLLQNQFASSDVEVEEDLKHIKRHSAVESLFEVGSSEFQRIETIKRRSVARSKSYMAHFALLGRATRYLELSRNISNKKLDEVVDGFISGQSGAADAASSQLMEAKHQLNQLHKYVIDLSMQVNATEKAIMALDKEMQDLLRQIEELEKWKENQLAECEKQTQEAIAMYGKLSDEMIEMKQIANPKVSMNIKTGKIEEASQLQTSVTTAMHNAAPNVATGKLRNATADNEMLQLLVKGTQDAAKQLLHCVGPQHKHSSMALLEAAVSQEPADAVPSVNEASGNNAASGIPSDEECQAEKENLHKVYVKTYVELSRLKNEYDELANSTACVDATMSQYAAQKNPLQQQIDDLLKAIDKKVKELQSLRPRLENASEAEKKMQEQVKKLTDEVGQLPETVSDLSKVRDAIQALSRCPGLSRVEFHLPIWIGTWVTFEQDAATMDDKKQDDLMDAACDKAASGSRAAEVGEIEEQSVEQIPITNTADVPLLGACPLCEGDEGSYVDKHARLCWQPDKNLNHVDKSTSCSKGMKAILCVMDRGTNGNTRSIPGEK